MHRTAAAHSASWLALPITALLAAAGCGSPSSPSTATDNPVRIHPGGEENMSTLILQLPPGACIQGESCAHPVTLPGLALDGQPMTFGTGLRVVPGAHTLTVNRLSTTVTLQAGLTRTLALPVAREVCQPEPIATLPATQFGRVPSLRNAACPSRVTLDGAALVNPSLTSVYFNNYSYCWGSFDGPYDLTTTSCANQYGYVYSVYINGYCFNTGYTARSTICTALQQNRCADLGIDASFCVPNNPWVYGNDVAVVPGAYGFTTESNAGPGTDVRTLHEGDLTDLTFSLPVIGSVPATFNTDLVFAEPRELPDATTASITSNCENHFYVPSSATGTLSLQAFRYPECSYVFTASGRSVALAQDSSNRITLYRIDVDNVTITREDHTTYETQGTYELYFQGASVAWPYATNSGIDVLPGTYDLVVRYQTAEGPKENHYSLTF